MKTHYKTHVKSYKLDYNADIEINNLQGFSILGEKNESSKIDNSEILQRTLKENEQLLNVLYQTALNNKANQEKIEYNLNLLRSGNVTFYNNSIQSSDNLGNIYEHLILSRNNDNNFPYLVTSNNLFNNPSLTMPFNTGLNNINNLSSSSYLNIKNIFEPFGGCKKPTDFN